MDGVVAGSGRKRESVRNTQTQRQTHGVGGGASQRLRLLLREDADAEVSVEVRLEGGRDDQVLARRQLEARADLPQVDEGLGPRRLRVRQEEVLVQVDLALPVELERPIRAGAEREGHLV